MDDRIRVSDADRERVAARLRDHYAEGRLTADELDERITAVLGAKTVGDLRGVTRDLPEPALAPQAGPPPSRPAPPWLAHRRGPRLLPILAVAALTVLLVQGVGWVFFLAIKVILALWLAALLAGLVAAAWFRRRVGHAWRAGYPPSAWHGGYRHHWRAYRRW